MKKASLKIVYKTAASLIPYVNNARTHNGKQVAQIAASIKEFGFTNPILIDDQSGIIAGHGRLMAANKLGLDKVPTITLTGLTDSQRRAYILADNRLALSAGWDEELLKTEMLALLKEDFDLPLTGFDDKEIELMIDLSGEEELPKIDASLYGGATAMHRASVPMRHWRETDLLKGDVLDFGCGNEDHEFEKYDAFSKPEVGPLIKKWDVIMCNYVLQVQPAAHLIDQLCALMRALLKPNGIALIAVRNDLKETTVSDRGTQVIMAKEEWEAQLRKFFWVEPQEVKAFHGFVCTNPTGDE